MADKLTREQIEAIREAAEKATPGPWYTTGQPWYTSGAGVLAYSPDGNIAALVADCEQWEGERDEWNDANPDRPLAHPDADATHIANCDPPTIIALCDMALSPALTAAREALEADIVDITDDMVIAAMEHIPGCDHDDMVVAIEAALNVKARSLHFHQAVGQMRDELSLADAKIAELKGALRNLELAVLSNGEWDDGCFYHNGTSAPELQRPLDAARAAIALLKEQTHG